MFRRGTTLIGPPRSSSSSTATRCPDRRPTPTSISANSAAQRGFFYAYPNGTLDSDGNRFWNATDACCDFHRTGVDDVAYLAGVIGEIRASFAIDPKRIDLIGHSNGGFMSYAMACAQADQIAAMVSLAGATFMAPTDCAPTDPVAVLQIHGTADDTIAFDGGTVGGMGPGGSGARLPRRRGLCRHMGDVQRMRDRVGR